LESILTGNTKATAQEYLCESAEVLTSLAQQPVEGILEATEVLVTCLRKGGKILLFGNGGSACDAQHFAGEIVGRFLREREGFPAIALGADGSVMTALGNDYGFDEVFARQVQAFGQTGDVAVGISTSGNSPNVLKALKVARSRAMKTLALTGPRPNKAAEIADGCIAIETKMTPMVQQAHITVIHLLCLLVEQALCEEGT